MDNGKRVLPVLQCLEVGIAFVSSFELHGLINRLSVRTNIGPTVRFLYHWYELESFSWHNVFL